MKTPVLPTGYVYLATVEINNELRLIARHAKGQYVNFDPQAQQQPVRMDGRSARKLIGEQSKRAVMLNGQRTQVYLDEQSRKIAIALGGGNMSHGIRKALLEFSEDE